ncbi:hypothetical protein ASE94_17750 [Devosia sp. Leaf64]|nr:hypothetical protein ASE94_17750 [Devosia sp. Leaf64]
MNIALPTLIAEKVDFAQSNVTRYVGRPQLREDRKLAKSVREIYLVVERARKCVRTATFKNLTNLRVDNQFGQGAVLRGSDREASYSLGYSTYIIVPIGDLIA